MTMLDLRQPDERDNFLPNPFWMSSAELTPAANALEAVFFSFPTIKGAVTQIHSMFFEITEVFNGTTPSILIGLGSIPLETSTTGATVTTTDADEYFETTEITEGTAGWYAPTTSDFFDMLTAGTIVAITHADSTVPCILATYTATTPTTGRGRLHALVSVLHAR
jgi:hypothetical protein